jgi:hypothetical protein
MEGRAFALREKVEKLLRETAAAKVALDRAEGTVRGVPHYSVIENAAHDIGQQVSRLVQAMHLQELVAGQAVSGKCPDCGTPAALEPRERKVLSGDGPIEATELRGYCSCCRRNFFPAAGSVGV